ncbi:MAG: hypothetical protein DBP02_13765 [gamma proteobacterium symbiont of Ctena orbiculata]|nr:MAG: hypothetical protein DBP02_13765 [gamma proteobacterium symbiont of Ctena orbiculata]
MENFLKARALPISWAKLFVLMSIVTIIIYLAFGSDIFLQIFEVLKTNLTNPYFYVWFLVFFLIYRVINNAEWKELKDWADYYGIEITYIRLFKLSEGKFKFNRLYRHEYRVGLKNTYGEVGEMYVFFIHKQLFNPFKEWITEPIQSPKFGEIPNELP